MRKLHAVGESLYLLSRLILVILSLLNLIAILLLNSPETSYFFMSSGADFLALVAAKGFVTFIVVIMCRRSTQFDS